jgi:Flp pilus assembly protein TadG
MRVRTEKNCTIRHAFRSFICGVDATSGAALVEASIIVPLLILVFLTIADFGMAFYGQIEVQHAAQAGAQYVIAKGFNSANISSAVTNAANLPNNATFIGGISAAPAPSQFCGCPSNTGVALHAAGQCAGNLVGQICGGSGTYGTYVTVSAKTTYAPIGIVRIGSVFTSNAFSANLTLTASSTVRIQ